MMSEASAPFQPEGRCEQDHARDHKPGELRDVRLASDHRADDDETERRQSTLRVRAKAAIANGRTSAAALS